MLQILFKRQLMFVVMLVIVAFDDFTFIVLFSSFHNIRICFLSSKECVVLGGLEISCY